MRAHVIENGVVINTIVVNDLNFMPGLISAENGGSIGDLWGGELFTKSPEPALTRDQKKEIRAAAVAAITVQVSTGKIFDGDEASQTRMSRTIIGMQATGRNTITWTLADNTITQVTLAEVTEAMCLAGEKQAALWPIE